MASSEENRNVRARFWTFTYNNYPEEAISKLLGFEWQYVGFAKEVGKKGTPHLQGCFYFKNQRTWGAINNKLQKIGVAIGFFEPAKGTPTQAIGYWKTPEQTHPERGKKNPREEDVYEAGVPPKDPADGGSAEQQRWEDARTAAKEGRLDDIPAELYSRYYRTWKEIAKDHMVEPPEAEDVTGVWIWGPPGVGKSRYARDTYPDAYKKLTNKWWDGYQDQEYVLMDEMELDSKVLGHHLKMWMDRYPFNAETKGGMRCIRPKKFIVTSNYSIEEVFAGDEMMVAAIRRRCQVIHMNEPFFKKPRQQ